MSDIVLEGASYVLKYSQIILTELDNFQPYDGTTKWQDCANCPGLKMQWVSVELPHLVSKCKDNRRLL